VAVAADDGEPGLGEPELRADDVHDALLGVVHGVERDAELRAVLAEGLDLRAGDRVGDRQQDVPGGDVVVFGGDREIGPAHAAAGEAEPVERLGAGDLVDEMQVDVEQVRLLPLPLADQMAVPHLLGQRLPPRRSHWAVSSTSQNSGS
jgi:hypothetical protein